jgi:hypothetical protein
VRIGSIRGSTVGLAGVWHRTLLVDARGERDVSTEVTWLQAACTYLDLRRPAGGPSFDGVRRLRDLDRTHLRWLATQEAFAGELIDQGDHVEWARAIDLHQPGAYPDAGTLQPAGDELIERGWYEDYAEHWRLAQAAAEPIWARHLVADASSGTRAIVLRVGETFGWARGRPGTLADRSLPELVEAAPLGEAQDAVDVEVSLGVIAAGQWVVTTSTLPYREGARLDLDIAGVRATTREPTPDGKLRTRSWTVTHQEGEVVM